MRRLTDEAREIVAEALRQVDVGGVVRRHVRCEDGRVVLGGDSVAFEELDQIVVVAVGKAALPMYEAACDGLRGVPVSAVVVTNQAADQRRNTGVLRFAQNDATFLAGSHPLPDAASLQAAEAVLWLLGEVTERTAVLFLISGGASAMMEAPLDSRIPVEETAAFYQALIGSGLPIAQMNALRKHFSAVKGGRLAEAAAKARMQYTVLISDVPANLPDAIGSGPSLPDSTTLEECRELLKAMQQKGPLPARVDGFFASALCVETPKPGDAAFDRAQWEVVLSSDHLADAAAEAARAAGFHVEIDHGCDEWEYRAAGRYLIERGVALSQRHKRLCLLSVGEVAVTLAGAVGEGGRNQQFALWCALELERLGVSAAVASVGSDGIDGNSRAAGAVCDETTPARARELGFSVEDALDRFDSAPLLRRVGAAIEIGPTGNNLRDLRMVLFG